MITAHTSLGPSEIQSQ